MEREVGGGIGMGNTWKPMAVSFQCMTKFTTNEKIKNKNKNKIKIKIKGRRPAEYREVRTFIMQSETARCLPTQPHPYLPMWWPLGTSRLSLVSTK